MNIFIIMGRICNEIEIRYTATGTAVCQFTVAVDRDRKDSAGNKATDFFRCNAFGKTAEFVQSYFSKGKMIGIEGQVNIDRVEKDGSKKEYISVNVSKCFFTGEKRDNSSHFDQQDSRQDNKQDSVYTDEDIPF